MIKLRQNVSFDNIDLLQFEESKSCPGVHVSPDAGDILLVIEVDLHKIRCDFNPEKFEIIGYFKTGVIESNFVTFSLFRL